MTTARSPRGRHGVDGLLANSIVHVAPRSELTHTSLRKTRLPSPHAYRPHFCTPSSQQMGESVRGVRDRSTAMRSRMKERGRERERGERKRERRERE
jgi:hypothetical protein